MASWAPAIVAGAILLYGYGACAQLSPGFSCELLDLEPVCGAECQFCQAQGLLGHIWTLNGPDWVYNTGWPASGSLSNYSALEHCSWFGVFCCGADHTLTGIDHPELLKYLLTDDTKCSVPYGVAVLLLSHNNLTGTLSSEFLSTSPLRLSLDIIALNSTPQAQCTHSMLDATSLCD